MRRFLSLMVAVSALSVQSVPASATLLVPEPVLLEAGDQSFPFANASWLTWASSSATRPNHVDAFARHLDGSGGRVRLNASGTEGYTGGIDPGSNRVLYQQISGSGSELFFFNLDTMQRTRALGVNSGWWERSPRISDAYILFARDVKVNGLWYSDLMLFRRSSGHLRRLDRFPAHSLFAESVGDRYATFTVCNPATTCKAYVYDSSTAATQRIASKNGRPQYATVVDEATGTVYFVRSGFGCGIDVGIWMTSTGLGAPPAKLVDLPNGIDTYGLSLGPGATGTDLYFSRHSCAKNISDIFAVRDVPPIA